MRLALTALLLCSSVWAQTKAAPKPAAKASPTKAKAAAKSSVPNLLNPETMNAKAPNLFIVRLETTKGNIDIRVVKSWAPNGVQRFYNLVRAGYYDNNYFFRVLDFMAQVGISSRPEVNRVWADRTMFDDRVIQSNRRGTVTFAAAGEPNSRSTQFFINKTENSRLDPLKFAPFGEVVEGMEFADQLYSGYGDPDIQGALVNKGDAVVKANYPRMDRIIKASILTVVEP
jgi:peptidyl-prolyl cis-trans isomerase A (cyclophilin A)